MIVYICNEELAFWNDSLQMLLLAKSIELEQL